MFCHTRIILFRTLLANLFAFSMLGASALGAQTLSMVSETARLSPSNFKPMRRSLLKPPAQTENPRPASP